MDAFTYLTVLVSIILGLGITQLLGGVGRLLQERDRVRMYAPAMVWVAILLLLHVQTWWAMFGLRALKTWTFGAFLLVLLQPIALYLLAALALPDRASETANDLRANYFSHARWFFVLGVLLVFVSLTRDRILAGHFPSATNTGVQLALLAGWGGGAVIRHEAYHRSLAFGTMILMVVYVVALFGHLP